MKIYWRGKDGKKPPKNAIFGWVPFYPGWPVPPVQNVERIDSLPKAADPIRVYQKKFLPEKEEWLSIIKKTKNAIFQKQFEKAVLARVCVLTCEKEPDPFSIAAVLQTRAKNATLFCFADETMAFLGATPEILFSRKGRHILSEAVAGTAKHSENENEFLQNPKPLSEIIPVQKYLEQKLLPLCENAPLFSPIFVKKTKNVQHLCSNVEGILKDKTLDADILTKLHPTPALCGAPSFAAMEWIRKHEPFDRGLYGGAIGWSTEEESLWAVSIRCCLILGKQVLLYTGAGIVEGSDPEEEWEELNNKMSLFEGIFV